VPVLARILAGQIGVRRALAGPISPASTKDYPIWTIDRTCHDPLDDHISMIAVTVALRT